MRTGTATHPQQITATRAALTEAQASAPLDPETAARVKARVGTEAYAAMEAEAAALYAQVPALTATLRELEARSCPRCSGSGNYQAPTHHLTKGKPVCWSCGGSGLR